MTTEGNTSFHLIGGVAGTQMAQRTQEGERDMRKAVFAALLAVALLAASISAAAPGGGGKMMGINIVLNTDITDAILTDLGRYGTVRDVLYGIDAVTLQAAESQLATIRQLPYVAAANPDAERNGSPVDTVTATDFSGGLSTWDLDAVNVKAGPASTDRTVPYDGSGVYVAVLDTGLLDTWRQYFPEERIAAEYAVAFGGGGGEVGTVSTQPEKWQHDVNSHGTHVTSSMIGYSLRGTPIDGVAPKATIIPVKVLSQAGWGWSSVVARGISHVADLKAGPLKDYPVIINMSLGGPNLDAMEQAAIDHAIAQGVIIVAAAGNEDYAGMGYPGAYEPVISVAASGWVGEWKAANWWRTLDVADPTSAGDFYITDFSSRELDGQDLDVAAPGSWVVGPYQTQSGQTSYYFLGGTSMASPHVAGIVALMAQQNPGLTAAQAESTLESTAIPLPPGCRTVIDPDIGPVEYCWDSDATGAGLATADRALGLVKAQGKGGKK